MARQRKTHNRTGNKGRQIFRGSNCDGGRVWLSGVGRWDREGVEVSVFSVVVTMFGGCNCGDVGYR